MSELDQLREAAKVVYASISPSPQIRWPLLESRLGCPVWLKHENHLPTGAFKVRGGLHYFAQLAATAMPERVICATRGNHGQSVAFAAAAAGVEAVIVVPRGNNPEKNAAIEGYGAKLLVEGDDFVESLRFADALAQKENLHWVPSYHQDLVVGVGTYALELLSAVPDLTRIYVPIGLGSGACGVLMAKAALQHSVQVIGVVSSHAPTYLQSIMKGYPIATDSAETIADGLAVREANPEALSWLRKGLSKVMSVTDDEVTEAMRILLKATHNLVEGAGAAPFAAALRDQASIGDGESVGVVISGGNVSSEVLKRTLEEG